MKSSTKLLEKIDRLRLQREQDLVEQKRLEGKVRSVINRQEKRRRFLAGEAALDLAGSDVSIKQALWAKIDATVSRARDRDLFSLPPKESPESTKAAPKNASG